MHKHEWGEVPWELEDLLEAFNWYVNLQERSNTDWILREAGIAIDDDSQHTGKWSIYSPQRQLEEYMLGRYRYRDDRGSAFLHRFWKIHEFLDEYESRLAAEPGLCHRRDDGIIELSLPVFRALGEVPYSRIIEADDGTKVRKFDYDEVISKARSYPDAEQASC